MRLEGVRAVTVCVDYHDVLAITLPRALQVFDSVCVLTSEADTTTQMIASKAGADVIVTDAFYARRAVFNKFAAIEIGLDVIGRSGWIAIVDADILFPERDHRTEFHFGRLVLPYRRMCREIPTEPPAERMWRRYRRSLLSDELFNYCQIFHADDPVLGIPPWNNVNWTWAGGAGSSLHEKWNPGKHMRPSWEVLHLGRPFQNWAGRVTPFADGSVHPDADQRRGVLENLLNQRRYHRGVDRYEAEKLT